MARREDTTMTKLCCQLEVHRVQMGKKRKEHLLRAAEGYGGAELTALVELEPMPAKIGRSDVSVAHSAS